MPQAPLSDELAISAVALVREHGSLSAASRASGIPWGTLKHRLQKAQERGLHLSEGARTIIAHGRLNPGEVRGGWQHVYDKDGRKMGATYWRAIDSPLGEDDIIERLAEAMRNLPPTEPVTPPATTVEGLLTLYPVFDAHVGLLSWRQETGEDYDLHIAQQQMTTALGALSALTPASRSAVLLIGGDFFHVDDNRARTPAAGNPLDTDGRYFKVVETGISILRTTVATLLSRHESVRIRVMRGNHDEHSHLVAHFALREMLRDEPRCTVEHTPQDLFILPHGKTLIAAHHGDRGKPEDRVLQIADTCAEWSATRHRYLFTGHIHHERSRDIGGMRWESLRAFAPRDAWTVGMGYSSRRALQTLTFDMELGLVTRASHPVT